MDQEGVEVHKHAKKYEANIRPSWLSKHYLLHGFWGNFSCETQRVVLSEKGSAVLPVRVANQSDLVILPAYRASQIIKSKYWLFVTLIIQSFYIVYRVVKFHWKKFVLFFLSLYPGSFIWQDAKSLLSINSTIFWNAALFPIWIVFSSSGYNTGHKRFF